MRLFCILMALHIFNISVDTPDADPDSKPEDLSYNDMESVVEIILEKCLDYDNAIAEHDEADEDCVTSKTIEIASDIIITDFFTYPFSTPLPSELLKVKTPYVGSCSSDHISEITPPPPKC